MTQGTVKLMDNVMWWGWLTETGGDHVWRFREVEVHAMCLSAKHDQIQATIGCQTTYICEKLLSLLCISRDRSDFEPETD